jgi:hypothetical protein
VERKLERAARRIQYRERGDDGAVTDSARLGRRCPWSGPGARREGAEEKGTRPALQGQVPVPALRERAGVIPSPAA